MTAAFNKESSKAANDKQQSKYKDVSAEMRRRQALRKTHGTGGWRWMKENDPERFKQIIEQREKNRAKNKNRSGGQAL